MRSFSYQRPESFESLSGLMSASIRGHEPPARSPDQFIAGGTTMADLMKLDVMQPNQLVDINGLGSRFAEIDASASGLHLGALVRMADAAAHPKIKADYPVLAQTLELAASQQIRNMATLGGNVLQRTRCAYFRDRAYACNKREPGSGCAALEGVNRQHAVLGVSDHCIATYPGDFAQALIALGATLEIQGPSSRRSLAFADLHHVPGETPHIETSLHPGELIVAIIVPSKPWNKRSHYVKIRDRDSYAFALASAAVALELEGDRVKHVRIALGGVATKPWRSREAEETLEGEMLTERSAQAAAEVAFAEAQTREHNAFKIPLGKATLVRALLEAKDMKV